MPATAVSSLEEAIAQQINLGRGDPLEIADAILRLYGEAEVRSWIDPRPVVMDAARHRLALNRRGNEAKALKEPINAAKFLRDGRSYTWIEGKGMIRTDQLTADDCMIRAEHLRKLERWHATKADLYENIAAAIRGAGVETLGELPEQTSLAFTGLLSQLDEAA